MKARTHKKILLNWNIKNKPPLDLDLTLSFFDSLARSLALICVGIALRLVGNVNELDTFLIASNQEKMVFFFKNIFLSFYHLSSACHFVCNLSATWNVRSDRALSRIKEQQYFNNRKKLSRKKNVGWCACRHIYKLTTVINLYMYVQSLRHIILVRCVCSRKNAAENVRVSIFIEI